MAEPKPDEGNRTCGRTILHARERFPVCNANTDSSTNTNTSIYTNANSSTNTSIYTSANSGTYASSYT